MNGNKRSHFRAEEQAVAVVAKALGHPARIAIVRLLATRAKCTSGELVAELPLSQSTVSQHLKELTAAGLVEAESTGARAGYALSPGR